MVCAVLFCNSSSRGPSETLKLESRRICFGVKHMETKKVFHLGCVFLCINCDFGILFPKFHKLSRCAELHLWIAFKISNFLHWRVFHLHLHRTLKISYVTRRRRRKRSWVPLETENKEMLLCYIDKPINESMYSDSCDLPISLAHDRQSLIALCSSGRFNDLRSENEDWDECWRMAILFTTRQDY